MQDQDGKVLEKWTISTNEEEPIILNQFLRFGETKSIAEVMLKELQIKDSQHVQKKNESDIRAFIERMSNGRKLNNVFSGSNLERLPSAMESPRTLQKTLLPGDITDEERQKTMKTKQTTEQRGSCQSVTVAAHNIHLANLEQTVLNAGVIHSRAQSCSIVNNANSNRDTSRRPSAVVNSVHVEPSSNSSNAPPLLSSSVSMFPHSTKRQSAFSYRGLRKIALSKRRGWTPYSIIANSKQVKCNTCSKWFYDKGTWKIHFGAVHLKVKYKCTVEGCNMAFSSLRSRNRHSANPSPRIHRIVYNSRRSQNKRKGGFEDAGMDIQHESGEQNCDIGEDDVAIVTDEDNKTDRDGDVVLLETEKQSTDTNASYSDIDNSNTTLDNSSPEMTTQEEIYQDASGDSSSDLMQDIKPEKTVGFVEKSNQMESLPFHIDVKPTDTMEQSQSNRDSPTMHHFKKRKSTAPRKVFIQRQEEDADCQEDVIFKTEEMKLQNDDIQQDVEEEEIGIDLDEVAEYESNHQDDGDISNEHQYRPPPMFNQKGRHSPEKITGSQSQGIDSLLQEQDNLRFHVAEQMGIGIDTCFYINTDGLPSCYLCEKTFQSKQTVKVHYQNVHLKLMHACTIEGCNAMFPSRRSRDRHSTNFNLHRKLFEKGVPLKDGFDQICPPEPTFGLAPGQTGDLEQRSNCKFSESKSTDLSEGIGKSHQLPVLGSGMNLDGSDNGIQLSSSSEIELGLTRQDLHSPCSKIRYNMQDNSASSSFGTCSSPPQRFIMQVDQNGQSPLAYNPTFNSQHVHVTPITPSHERQPFKFVGSLICNICKKAYSTKDTLRTHYKNIHLREMHKCTIQGCNLMFSSVRSRNRHSQNPNLHRHCLDSDENPDRTDRVNEKQ